MKHKLYTLALAAVLAVAALPNQAKADQIVIQPLFEYPTAPDTIQSLTARSNYLMNHFWDQMDFTQKSTVDQIALNDAFAVYVSAMQFADANVAETSISKILERTAKNPALAIQFTRAAEESLYGPRADVWSDQVYLKFIDAILKNKKVSNDRKLRFKRHGILLRNSMVGSTPPEFDYELPTGNIAHFHPNGIITVIEFGDPDCDECRFSKLKLETDVQFSSLVDRGLVNVLFIIPDPEEGWNTKLADYSPKWHVGASDTVSDLFDMRVTPSLYVIDSKGQIAAKNITVTQAMKIAADAVQQTQQ